MADQRDVIKFRDVALAFLVNELDIAETFVQMAQRSDNPEREARSRHNARIGYDTVVRHMCLLPPDDCRHLSGKLDSLKSKLAELGEEI